MNAGTARERPARVLILVENLPVPFDRRVWNEARTLARAGYTVRVICPATRDYPEGYTLLDGVHLYRYPPLLEARSLPGFFLEYAIALVMHACLTFWIALRHGVDVIHACNPPDLLFLVAWPFVRLGRARFLFDHHDLSPEMYAAKFGRAGFLHSLLLMCEAGTYRCADVVIATNESYAAVARERGRKSPDDIFIVRSGPDTSRIAPRPPDPALRGGAHYLVGYVGVMGSQDGVDVLMQVIHHCTHARARTDIRWVLCGDGPERRMLEARARRMALDDRIVFTGRIPDEELMRWLSTADVCVAPDPQTAHNDKSTMNKVLEYMTLGKPLVQFDLTEGCRAAGEASLYAPPGDVEAFGDAILELLDDPDRRAAMGHTGRARIDTELAWDHQEPHLLAAYERVLADR